MPSTDLKDAGLEPHQILADRLIKLAMIDVFSKREKTRVEAIEFLFSEEEEAAKGLRFWAMVLGVEVEKVREWANKKIGKRLSKQPRDVVE